MRASCTSDSSGPAPLPTWHLTFIACSICRSRSWRTPPWSRNAHTNALRVEVGAEADLFITISDYNRRTLLDRYGVLAEKVEVVHCGVRSGDGDGTGDDVGDQAQAAGARPEKTRGSRPPMIVAVARLSEKKGHDILITACALLRDRGVPFRCRIVGGGEREAELQALVAGLNLDDFVELVGPLDHADAIRVLASADLGALACRVAADGDQDGIPVSLMETMALGIPVVSTKVSGIPELVHDGQNGIVVQPDDPAAFADALAALLDDANLRHEYGAAARHTVKQEFDIGRCAAATRRLLEQAAPALNAFGAARDQMPPQAGTPERATPA